MMIVFAFINKAARCSFRRPHLSSNYGLMINLISLINSNLAFVHVEHLEKTFEGEEEKGNAVNPNYQLGNEIFSHPIE